jgi:hypothetical protein
VSGVDIPRGQLYTSPSPLPKRKTTTDELMDREFTSEAFKSS